MSFDAQKKTTLENLLDKYSETENTMRADEAQAFLVALASGPDAVDVEIWLPEVLGNPDLFTEEEKATIESLLNDMLHDIQESLADGRVPELILYPDEYGEQDYFSWSNAYLYALDVTETDWFEVASDEAFEDLFYPIMALGGMFEDEDASISIDFDPEEQQAFRQELPEAILALYRYWQVVGQKPVTIVRDDEKVGRNDACSCGSGKKYKTCCGRD